MKRWKHSYNLQLKHDMDTELEIKKCLNPAAYTLQVYITEIYNI